ncbi:thiol:disulfide interchange protein DsbA/DsbL [Frateuria terrea]|uniref:Thiol:disulfide interchange protein DsbA n=1 Tax=Frateuria terrea TaxID=529704 RepID=A0A1H6S7I1_9GAMM|nr:thiol:disulfide interchange protein DsbA/DsbL [Frateuria terrea]SEI64068.1 thiol:disulfide interchange protein DsbA [Frateuria terrea]SFP24391.1 thiol:disulfide interchange protein DsbA [Frateuria terrea]
MLKRLPILCAAVFALAACSHDSDTGSAPAAPTASGTAATAPAVPAAPAASGSTAPAPAASTPASAGSAETTAPANAAAPPGEPFADTGKWVEGKNYFRIEPAQPKATSTDKIEVTEVFSYGCPACNQFHPIVEQLAASLPSNAVMAYLPASFIPQENWPMLQRAYFTAKALGVADKCNDAMYDAVWKSGELSAMNPAGNGLKPHDALPTIADAAKVYAKCGADPKEFAAVASSFSINTQAKRADDLVKAYGVTGTPTLVVDGKYRFSPSDAGGYPQTIELTKWLVAKEAAGK